MVSQIVIIDKKRVYVKDYLLILKEGSNRLFLGIEQGSGKYSNDIFVLIALKQKLNIMKWATKVYGCEILAEGKDSPYTISILLYMDKEPIEYQEELQEFIR